MPNDRKLKKDYRIIQEQAAPDLWARIESEIQPFDRSAETEQVLPIPKKRHRARIYSGAAAAVLAGLVITGQITGRFGSGSGFTMSKSTAVESVPETVSQAEQNTWDLEHTQTEADFLQVNFLRVPKDARTVSSDAEYFSEEMLKETDLLCRAVINDISFAQDETGRTTHVLYEITIDSVCYSTDYMAPTDIISVSSPIIETMGDEAYLLYQMQRGRAYLLPLKQQEGWELLYPFAPQIQIVGEQQFLFHSGYTSLVNEETHVVEGVQEGDNDYYYDRMLMRTDNTFLSDLLLLVK